MSPHRISRIAPELCVSDALLDDPRVSALVMTLQTTWYRRLLAGNSRPDPDLKVRTALDRAAARIAGKFEAQPLVEASIRHTIAGAYADLG
jgi:hypothetical protein